MCVCVRTFPDTRDAQIERAKVLGKNPTIKENDESAAGDDKKGGSGYVPPQLRGREADQQVRPVLLVCTWSGLEALL